MMSVLYECSCVKGNRHFPVGVAESPSFERGMHTRTYNMDAQVGESSACATALLCGVKANYETVGLDSSARFEDCYSSFEARVSSLINWAQDQGKSSRVDINLQKKIATIKMITVILGGGRRHFVPKVTLDPEEPEKEGRRLDGRNLIEEWSRNHRKRNIVAKYVANKEQFEKVDTRRVNRLLGLFAYSHMDFNVDRNTNDTGDPSLAEMAIKALRILANNPEGYFLFVEGGRIDHAHHYNNAYRALDETLALEEAVEAVMKEVDLTETLLVVTADHSHVLTLGGLATLRGNPIFGSDSKVSDVDGQPYTTLLYSNGPGYIHPRNILREAGKDSIQTAGVPRAWATHGGEDVPVFAVGPLANALFSGSIDQSYIPHAIAYAACLAHHASRCSRDSTNNANASDTMNAAPISCPSAEPNSAAISSDVMNDRMRNPPTKSAGGPCRSLAGSPSLLLMLLLLLLLQAPLMPLIPIVLLIPRCPFERTS
ncbi:PREDICTED: alkaline phosphatase, tissue-nonspecific isozyme-like [Atta cephalotes]|uniref:alkaline phosphatase n=1 Tax=Atta cephalotes TaxID=12957 RepID=A0A158P1M7_ATTCE|nr:PREDICTED: alkaline phosphatase, tissue-nonspecific isozyme-like [Atta cephalotes]